MDQNTLVSGQAENGKRLLNALAEAGFEVRLAFWAKPTEEDRWYLYLASPVMETRDPRVAYGRVLEVMRASPDL